MRHATVDLWDLFEEESDRLDFHFQKVEEIEASMNDVVSGVEEKYGDLETLREEEGDDKADSVEETYEGLQDSWQEHKGEVAHLDGLEERLEYLEQPDSEVPQDEDGWGGTEFRLSEATAGDMANVEGDVKQAFPGLERIDEAEQSMQNALLSYTLERAPDGAPDKTANYPVVVSQLLSKQVAEISGMHVPGMESEEGNLSLQERLAS